MIIVTGATGKLGHAVVEALLTRVDADQVGVSVRDPAAAQDLADRGVRVRKGSFDDRDALAHSFEGARRILLVSVPSTGEELLGLHRTAIEVAMASGAQRLFYTSHAGAAPDSPFPPMPNHHATEAMLRGSGVPATVLRNGFYADSAVMLLGDAVQTGELAAPQDGPVDWTTHADLATGAAAALADPDLDQDVLELTAAEAVDLEGIAARASEITGRSIRRTVVSDGQHEQQLAARGLPAPAIGMVMGIFRAARAGGFARTSPTLEGLLGRPPATLHDHLATVL